MSKTTTKKATESKAKKATPKKATKATTVTIDRACELALEKLKVLKAEPQLQADLAWCIGSYRYDRNPVGLVEQGAKALQALSAAKAKNPRAVSAKLISDLKKALKG